MPELLHKSADHYLEPILLNGRDRIRKPCNPRVTATGFPQYILVIVVANGVWGISPPVGSWISF